MPPPTYLVNAPVEPPAAPVPCSGDVLFAERRGRMLRQSDRLFGWLLLLQVAAGFASLWLGGWSADTLVPAAVASVICLSVATQALVRPEFMPTRYLVSGAQGLIAILVVHNGGLDARAYVHVLGSLAFLSFYGDWRVLIPASAVILADHLLFAELSARGAAPASAAWWLERMIWVGFADLFLAVGCLRGEREMRWSAHQTAESRRRQMELAATRETALDCIIGMDADGLVTEFNPAAEITFGLKRADVVGRQLADLIVPPALRGAHRDGLRKFLATGEGPVLGKRIEVPAVRGDGSEFPVEIAITCIPVTGGRPHFVAYLRDITDRKRFEEQARHATKLALVAARTDNAVVITDTAGRVEWVNEGFTRITGYQLDEVIGKKPGGMLQGPDTDPATVAYIRQQLAKGEGFSTEIVNYSKAGRKYWLAIEVRPVHDASGKLTNFIAIESDVTEPKRARSDLLAAKEQAEAASEAKSQFLANMSHEIRTPLNGVIGMAELLLRRGGLSEDQQRYARVIKSSADALLSLINDVLDFSKIEAGKLELSEVTFEPRTLVEDVVEMLAGRAQAKGLECACRLDASVPAQLRGDPDRLRQVLINLVTNAIKFTASGSVIVSVGRVEGGAAAGKTTLRFAVTDTGIGIPPDRLDRLFKSFSQVDASTTRKYGGTGLGLAIVKQLSELMGGQVGVESAEGRGSTFWFTACLGAVDEAPAAAASPVPDPTQFRGLRVLAVDDHEAYRNILCDQLSAWGYEVETAVDGAEALAAIRGAHEAGRPFAAVVADVVMPRMDGLELGRALVADGRFGRVAFVTLSAMDRTYAAAEREAAGVDVCLVKPVRQSQLFDALATALARRRQAAKQPVVADAPAAEVTSERIAARVLLAEDNEVNQEVARELLTDAGCRVDVVGNGRQAVEAACREPASYDLVLMDCQMPELDGFGAAREIREIERAGRTLGLRGRLPIVALTANAVEGDRERCLAAGMDDYVTKPIDPEQLVATIRRVLRKGEAPPAAEAKPAEAAAPSPIDVASLVKRCMGKASLAERLIGMFADGVSAQVESLQAALRSQDAALAARAAHTLKGSASNLSAGGVSAVASELEKLAHGQAWGEAESALATLRTEVERCLAYVPEARATVGRSAPPVKN